MRRKKLNLHQACVAYIKREQGGIHPHDTRYQRLSKILEEKAGLGKHHQSWTYKQRCEHAAKVLKIKYYQTRKRMRKSSIDTATNTVIWGDTWEGI